MIQEAETASELMDRIFVECSALGFQSVVTSILAIACYVLWRRQRGDYFLTWAMAWAVYVVRLGCMSAFLVRRDMVWLFVHQAATGVSALLLLAAALQMSRGFVLRPIHAVAIPISIAWAWITIYGMGSMIVGGISATVLLSSVTMWTGVVFWRERARISSGAAPVLAGAFILWGLHHLDYPLLRGFGAAVLYGVFADVLFLFAIGLGLLFVVLGDERDRLAERTAELEQLTRLMLRVQEDERRRIARELHDEAGQVLTAVKIELELDGRQEAGAMVGRALAQVRDLSNLLRPSVLDDLGLAPALRALADDFAARTRIAVHLDLEGAGRRLAPDVEVVIYRVVQEALTNVARHAGAAQARVRVASDERAVGLAVEDDGRGAADDARPHLGWLGMRERVAALGGRLAIGRAATAASGSTPTSRSGRRHDGRPVRVLLADDHTLVRSGIRRILEGAARRRGRGRGRRRRQRPRSAADHGGGRAVLDLKMPGSERLDLVREAKAARPELRVIVLTMHDGREYVARAIRGGADAYLLKDSAVQDLVAALEAVTAGHTYFSPPIQQQLAGLLRAGAPAPGGPALTEREREVLAWLARGLSSRQVAEELDISVRTVETHRANLMQKLGVKSVALLIQVAIREGILEQP